MEGNRISAVTGPDTAVPGDDVQFIDGGGTAYLMPGLIESHVHLSIDDVDDLAKIGSIPPEENTLLAMRIAGRYVIKPVISGDTFMPHAPSTSTVMSEAEVAAAAEVVHAHGKRMSAHARSAGAVKLCVRHGVKVIYHANFADEEAIDMLTEHRDELFITQG